MGMLLSLVIGGMGFQAMGLSSEIGALVMGVLLSTQARPRNWATSLWSLKEIFLVGFFLQIGLTGLPDWGAMAFAVAMGIVLPSRARCSSRSWSRSNCARAARS
jgi:predicted Kef-type K+ transport protein